MTAHRLNRNEYTNTIRDLRACTSGRKILPRRRLRRRLRQHGRCPYGVAALMERYFSAAEQIARWAISTEIPVKPIEADYRARDRKIRRIDRSTIEADHRVEFAGEHVIRFGLPGERPPVDGRDAAPVTLGFWMNAVDDEDVQDEAVRSSTSIPTWKRRSGCTSPRAITSSAPASLATSSSRRCRTRPPTIAERTSSSTRSCSSDHIGRQW